MRCSATTPRPRPRVPQPGSGSSCRAPASTRARPCASRSSYGAKAYPRPRDAVETIALVGLEDKAGRAIKTLSGGQQRRLDLALALVGDPELIFLDEPTTGFDPAARRTAWGVIRSLKELGKTVVLTTHYLDEAQALSDRVAIVQAAHRGRGPAAELAPASRTYRVSYTRGGDRIELETDDPTELLHRLTSEALAARRAARGPRRHPAVARGRLPGADLDRGRGGRRRVADEHRRAGLEQFRFEPASFWRNPSAAFFNFMLPLIFLVLIAPRVASRTATTWTSSCPGSPAWR